MRRSGDINVQNGVRNAQTAYRHTKQNIRKMKTGAIAVGERIEKSTVGRTASYWGDKVNSNWEAKKNGTLLPKEEAAAKKSLPMNCISMPKQVNIFQDQYLRICK